jgi:3'(2'), 5'-bisphosphate nucleotidase
MTPMVQTFYKHCNGINSDNGVTLKADKSVFTIADGIVQTLLINYLFKQENFKSIVGEEDAEVNIIDKTAGYSVDGLTVPDEYIPLIDQCRDAMTALSNEINKEAYQDLTIFIDPIDGTREFSTALGEQCSICIGFSDGGGKPVAGIVYRPIDCTYATGAASEGYFEQKLNMAEVSNDKGFLTSNGSISPFIKDLIERLGFERVCSGGAGNKMLMLLEGKGAAYIQDRGVSRWDTSGAQAVIEAKGGLLMKLSPFVSTKSLESYTYLQADLNTDFEEGLAYLTPYNANDKDAVKKGDAPRAGARGEFKAYSNICGLLALNAQGKDSLGSIFDGMHSTIDAGFKPSYD